MASQTSNTGSPQASSPSTAPVLSFKKRKNKVPASPKVTIENNPEDHTNAVNLTNPSTPISVPGTPVSGGTRKVSNRRKALQDFYKLSHAGDAPNESGLGISESSKTDKNVSKTMQIGEKENSADSDSILEKLRTEEALETFIKTASARDILRARNTAAKRLNLHDSERKSIIYNNYSELIKLNHILSDVFAGKTAENSEFSHAEDEATVSNENIDEYLSSLSDFLRSEAAVFNSDFPDVVEGLCSGVSDAVSVSSVTGIAGED
ncbi:hypothetical protein OXX79_000782 [Metschnikowia pulcherrima]